MLTRLDKSALVLLLFTLGLLGFVLFGTSRSTSVLVPHPEHLPQSSLSLKPELPLAPSWDKLLETHCNELLEESYDANDILARNTVEELENLLERDISKVHKKVGPLLEELASLKGTSHLAWLMTKDQVSGSSDLPSFVDDRLRPEFGMPLSILMAEVEKGLVAYEEELAVRATKLSTAIIAYAHTLEYGDAERGEELLRGFQHHQQTFQTTLSDISAHTTFGVIGATLTAIFAKATVSASRTVLGHISARMATATGVGVTASALDGPFPFGEALLVVLEVGGAAWSAYDIHKAQVVLKRDLRNQLIDSLKTTRRDIRRMIYERVQTRLEQHRLRNQKLVDSLLGTT